MDEPTERTGLVTFVTRARMNISRLTIVKFLELVLACIIIWLHYKTFAANGTVEHFVVDCTYAGFVIIVLGTFLGQITGHPVNRTMDMFFCVIGAVMYIASGSISINYFRNWSFHSKEDSMGIALGSLAIVQGAVFILDAFFVFKHQ